MTDPDVAQQQLYVLRRRLYHARLRRHVFSHCSYDKTVSASFRKALRGIHTAGIYHGA
eukprot:CAMPEP_0172555636 /NCGR_PEP_ID=MMETSP1067-20121228/59161_1 /TAXON_ID=265564 ORGANISM="Thalassiosira punctigera, Strain Tpunct2005C2" /NCGR_SAMPLE_ID=MMETSP1067 /ASSEMBLY_ACC=CAM_ASM_000444 /LENGTH=57 /DNA_ID=CAMNT_0013344177 /DNA_START=178 /DNA_END=351 /DNA_ORIENTATION=+